LGSHSGQYVQSRHAHEFPEGARQAGEGGSGPVPPGGNDPIGEADRRAAHIAIFQKLIEGQPEQVALLDADWNIVTVNPAWANTAKLRGFDELQPGHNYLHVLEHVLEINPVEARDSAGPVVKALHEMQQGKRTSFRHVYSGVGPRAGMEFQIRIALVELGGKTYATVTRHDVTELVQLRRLRQGFSTSLIKTQEEERRRMGRELHDSTMQQLCALGLALGQLRHTALPADAVRLVYEIEEFLVEAQRELRSIAYLAHPPQLDQMTLGEAMRLLVEGFGGRAELETTFEIDGESDVAWPNARVALYRVVQEALSNVHRHAKATRLSVRLVSRKSHLHVVVADDGRGIPAEVRQGVGLLGMRARLAELGGRLSIRKLSPGTAIVGSLKRG